MSVSFTAESGTAAFTSVSASATPETAFQGQSVSVAPAAASTVAKPIHARSHLMDLKTGKTGITPPEWKLDESAICGPTGTGQTPSGGESTDLSHIRGTPPGGSSSGDQTSMGLLPQEYLAAGEQNTFGVEPSGMGGYAQRQATVHYSDQTSMGLLHPQDYLGGGSGEGGGAASSQNTFWTTIPPTQQTTTPQLNSVSEDEDCIEDEPQTPESLDRSTETVVRVKVVPKASRIPRYQFHPLGAASRTHVSSASSGNGGAELTAVTEAQSTLAEFSTMTTADLPEKYLMPQSNHHSHSHGEEDAREGETPEVEVFNCFSNAPPQQFDEDFVQQAFNCSEHSGANGSTNKSLMDEAELENSRRFSEIPAVVDPAEPSPLLVKTFSKLPSSEVIEEDYNTTQETNDERAVDPHQPMMFDFSDAPEQNFDEDFLMEAFGGPPVSPTGGASSHFRDGTGRSDNRTMMDNAEKENQEQYRFIQEENMSYVSATSTSTGIHHEGSNSLQQQQQSFDSMLEYLRLGTSRLGPSFDDELNSNCSMVSTSKQRPNFGFDTAIKSPVFRPVAAITPSAATTAGSKSPSSSLQASKSGEFSSEKVNGTNEVLSGDSRQSVSDVSGIEPHFEQPHEQRELSSRLSSSIEGQYYIEGQSLDNEPGREIKSAMGTPAVVDKSSACQTPSNAKSVVNNAESKQASELFDTFIQNSGVTDDGLSRNLSRPDSQTSAVNHYNPHPDLISFTESSVTSGMANMHLNPSPVTARAVEEEKSQNILDISDLQNHIQKFDVRKESVYETEGCNNRTLEETVHDEVLEKTGLDADYRTIAAILAVAPVGMPPKFYAELVTKELKSSLLQQDVSRKKAESPSAFLPSFLADSSISQAEDNASPSLPVKPDNKIVTKVREVAAVDEKENQQEGSSTKPHRRVSQLRHSSPIKALQQRNPNSIEGPTQLKKQLFIGDSDMAASKPIATAATSVVEGHITDLTISQDPKRFPLECNKVALHWLDVSTSEDQFVVLRNTRNDSYLSVKLIIRGPARSAFAFKENWSKSRPSLDIRLPPGGKRDVFVSFQPETSGQSYEASLIVKPQYSSQSSSRKGGGSKGVSLKGVIPLVGFSGKASIKLFSGKNGEKLLPEMKCDGTELNIQAVNSGDATGFVKVSAFTDADLKVPCPPDMVAISPEMSVLEPGQKTTFSLSQTAHSNHQHQPSSSRDSSVYHLVIFHGSDLARRVYCKTRKDEEEGLLQHLMLGQQAFDCSADVRMSLPVELARVSTKDTAHFYDKVKWQSHSLTFTQPIRPQSPTFLVPHVEETFNQSAMLGVTTDFETSIAVTRDRHNLFGLGSSVPTRNQSAVDQLKSSTNFSSSPPLHRDDTKVTRNKPIASTEVEMALGAPEQPMSVQQSSERQTSEQDASADQKMSVRKVGRNQGVYLDTQEVCFPSVQTGSSSVAKITLHNRTREVASFEVSPAEAPFKGYHTRVQVKPRHYLNIPVRYTPENHGVHNCNLKLRNLSNGQVFVAKLVGKTRLV